MAFSLRNIISNISYFKKPGDGEDSTRSAEVVPPKRNKASFEHSEADSTSTQWTSLQLPDSEKTFTSNRASLSDTDILSLSDAPLRHRRRKCKKLRLDVQKASQSMNQIDVNVENTPKHVLLECQTADTFGERFKGFDFNKSFDIDDISGFDSSLEDQELRSDHSSSSSKSPVRMCRKACLEFASCDEGRPTESTTPESFADIELDKNEEQRTELLRTYQTKLEKLNGCLKNVFDELQFHIEVSKVFQLKSVVAPLTETNLSNISTNLKEVDPSGSWNIIIETEDHRAKSKVKEQLFSAKSRIDDFIENYLQDDGKNKYLLKKRKVQKRINPKKKQKHYDFPDLRDALVNLFSSEDSSQSGFEELKCLCNCHSSRPDSGALTMSPEHSTSVSSSIGHFSLDTSLLTAYSESLDQLSCSGSRDSFHGLAAQKTAVERIIFYVQVHSIRLLNEPNLEIKDPSFFYCQACQLDDLDENELIAHILSQAHCEKIHFLYKTAYIKKCVASGKEIQPSTVLNPMTMYRDDNKVVCFGDGLYACSLCFESHIVGESVLMAHCCAPEHVARRRALKGSLERLS